MVIGLIAQTGQRCLDSCGGRRQQRWVGLPRRRGLFSLRWWRHPCDRHRKPLRRVRDSGVLGRLDDRRRRSHLPDLA